MTSVINPFEDFNIDLIEEIKEYFKEKSEKEKRKSELNEFLGHRSQWQLEEDDFWYDKDSL